MHPHSIHKLLPVLLLSFSFWTHAQEEDEPEKVDFDSNKWKTSDNLTIKTLNKTNRTFALESAGSGKNKFEQFAYIPTVKNNKESYRITCKHIPAFHKETKATVTANIAWSLKDKNKKELQEEKVQYWSLPYEVDLKDLSGNTLNVVCACMEATKKVPDSSSEEEKKRGEIHYGTIYDANLTLGVKTMTFNTHPDKIENDAFDIVDRVKGKVINNTPEFKDGKQVSSSTIVVYPVGTKPTVKVKLQMISERLTPDQLQKLDWKAEAASHQKGAGEEEESVPRENILPDLTLGDSGTLNKETKDKILFMEGDFSPKKTLEKTMVRGKIDLNWKLKLGEDEIKMKKETRSKINTAFRILRTKEIDQKPQENTKIWFQGIVVAADVLQSTPCSTDNEYAQNLTSSIYDNSVYPDPLIRQFHTQNTVGTETHYNIYLGRMINMYYDINEKNKIICVEAAAMFRSCYNLVTDGTATAASIARPRGSGHQFGMLGGKVYDPTPALEKPENPPLPNARLGNLSLSEYVNEWNKKAPEDNKWFIKREETKHKVSN